MNTSAPVIERDRIQKPLLKWAGGKSQLLNDLLPIAPKKYNKYIEPFFGGGAMFFAINPRNAVVSDSNPEIINFYKCVRDNPEKVIGNLRNKTNTEEFFYSIRKENFNELPPFEAAARTFYLNRTCFNGLYRVNRQGQFNVPFGKYKNPNLCPEDPIYAVSKILKNTVIELGDYKDILRRYAQRGDFVFLDPPYLPISANADFKRYTKEQFHENDHRELAQEVKRLQGIGCHVVLTNSNHPLVHELYRNYKITILNTKRHINSKANKRTGEDVIVQCRPSSIKPVRAKQFDPDPQIMKYPSTRFMGSKEKIVPHIYDIARQFEFNSAIDLFSGTGVVGYMFKTMGKRVISNDYMAMSAVFSKAMIENNDYIFPEADVDKLFIPSGKTSSFVRDTYKNLYFKDDDNYMIDVIRSNINNMRHPSKKAIAQAALIRACLKKRARGVFTYTGLRYDDGRADLRISIEEHVRNAIDLINDSIFDNGKACISRMGDAMSIRHQADLVYIDPPYFSPLSDNEYVRRYHFVEGLARNWKGVDMQWHTKTKKFKSYPTPFSSKKGAYDAFEALFKKMRNSIIMVSYSSNSLPTKNEIKSLMLKYKNHVEVIDVDRKRRTAHILAFEQS